MLADSLKPLAAFWKPCSKPPSTKTLPPTDELKALGWLPASEFASVARDVVVRDILDPLAGIDIIIRDDERTALLLG